MARRGRALGVVAVASLLLAACSSSDGDAVDVAESVVTAPDTPAPTTVLPTTDAPTTTTTAAPATTVDPAEELAAAVEADLLEALDLLNIGLQNPGSDQKRDAALDRFIGANRQFISDRFDEFRSNGYAIRRNPSVEPVVVIEVPAQLIEPSNDLVRIQVCDVDSWITVEAGAGPNGSDAVVDPTLTAYRTVFFMRDVDDVWKIEGGEQLGEWSGVEVCPPA